MPDEIRLQPERALLRALQPLVAHRADVQRQIDLEHKQAVSAAEMEHRKRTASIRESAEAALAKMARDHEAVMAALTERLDKHIVDAEAARERELAKFAIGLGELERRAETQAEEARWLADTVGESTIRKANLTHEAATKALKARRDDLEVARDRANQILQRLGRSMEPLATLSPAASDEAVGDGPEKTIDAPTPAALDAAALDVATRVHAVDHAVNPFWLRGEGIGLALVLFAGAGGAAGAFAVQPTLPRNVGIGVAAGLALVFVLLLVVRALARRRVEPAIAALASALASTAALLNESQQIVDQNRDRVVRRMKASRHKETTAAVARLDEAKNKYERRRNVEEPELRASLQERIEYVRARKERKLREAETSYQNSVRRREQARDVELMEVDSQREMAVERAAKQAAERFDRLREQWLREGNELLLSGHRLNRSSSEDAPTWSKLLTREPRSESSDLIRFAWTTVDLASMPGGLPGEGELALAHQTSLQLPLHLDLRGSGSLVLHATPDTRARALDAVRATMLRLLTQLPPGKVRFTMLDPVGLGQSFAGFMHLADDEPLIVGDRIWTEPKHIEQKLADLTEHMEQVIQKYLRNEFASIQEYNEKAGEIAEPFRFLVIADFPANFSEAAAKRLASIVSSGPRCGVFTLIVTDSRARPPAWLTMADVERGATVLTVKPDAVSARVDELARWNIELESAPADEEFVRLIRRIGEVSKDSSRVQVPFQSIAPADDEVWSRDSAKEIAIPIGRSGATKVQSLVLGRGTAQHALIAGRTGSGKSTLLHAIITSLALWYSPDQAEVYLVDFKKGVEFKTYASNQLPHARVIAVESEREFGLSVLRRLDAELSRRGTIFRDLGVQDLAGYRATLKGRDKPGGSINDPMPRTLLIVDEFQEFFVEDDKIAQEAMLLLDRLVRQGRAFGMHVILGSQTIGGAYSLARSTIGQMGVRVALQCSESDSYLILSEDNPAARLLTRPGEAIYNDASGLLEGNSPFQVVWLPDDQRDTKLEHVREKAAGMKRVPPVIFEGNLPSDLARNHGLRELLDSPAPTGPTRVWLGDAVSIKDPTFAVLRPQSGSNILIVGQNERAAFGLLVGAGVALAARHRTQFSTPSGSLPRLTVLEGPSPEWDGVSPTLDLCNRIGPRARHAVGRAVDNALADLHAELERRRSPEHADAAAHEPLFLLVHALHRLRALRKAEDDYSFTASEDATPKPEKQFAEILREGPAVGIHTIAWCDNVANLERAIDRRDVREFDLRVLFQMSGGDSSSLIDSPHAQSLGQNRALLYSEEAGTFEKFRPYAPPPADVLDRMLARG
ncbi:MAG TPA: FtsK/SpoIIIE domain-containing protein [Phycisphaerales bacterium]